MFTRAKGLMRIDRDCLGVGDWGKVRIPESNGNRGYGLEGFFEQAVLCSRLGIGEIPDPHIEVCLYEAISFESAHNARDFEEPERKALPAFQ